MSTTPEINNKMANLKPKKVVVPKVWKRPHSTIYGKNVEFGSKLYSDKLGEINGRKFNSELPWQMRNSGGTSSTSGSSTSQGYLSKLLNEPQTTLIGSVITSKPTVTTSFRSLGPNEDRERWLTPNCCTSYADVLELTNPNRYSKRRADLARDRSRFRSSMMHDNGKMAVAADNQPRRIDFYENYLDFNDEIRRMNESSRLLNDPLMQRRAFDKYLDFNYELGLFVPASSSTSSSSSAMKADDGRGLARKRTLDKANKLTDSESKPKEWGQSQVPKYQQISSSGSCSRDSCYSTRGDDTQNPNGVVGNLSLHQPQQKQQQQHAWHDQRRLSLEHQSDINPAHFNPVITTTKNTQLLPKHDCQLADSPYGQSADGRKLSLGSINPHSYRPSLPHKTTTVHASDGEEFEFQDRSSPFYTDRWAGRTIRHFDSDLYSNANLFKSMIL